MRLLAWSIAWAVLLTMGTAQAADWTAVKLHGMVYADAGGGNARGVTDSTQAFAPYRTRGAREARRHSLRSMNDAAGIPQGRRTSPGPNTLLTFYPVRFERKPGVFGCAARVDRLCDCRVAMALSPDEPSRGRARQRR